MGIEVVLAFPNTGKQITNAWIVVENAVCADLSNQVSVLGQALIDILQNESDPAATARLFPSAVSKRLYNCYIRSEGYFDLVATREKLQELYDYQHGVRCVGWWDFKTGRPIGGAGSPWFQTFPSFYADFPLPERPTDLSGNAEPMDKNRILVAGQARRQFV